MYKVLKKEDWKISEWSGGITNEIFIYPFSSNYASRNFKGRISIATTNTEDKSLFTSLPNVDRFISKLDGKMKLSHQKKYDLTVEKYEIERFKGDWETFSYGKYKDFNLMLKGIRGDLYFRDNQNKSCKLHLEKDSNVVWVFIVEGEITINEVKLVAEDFYYTDENILNISEGNGKIFYGFMKEWD